jgi:histidine triad (HIT) family protein
MVSQEIPCRKVYEDDDMLAFHDIHPAAPVHLLVIPKQHIDSLAHTRTEHETILGRLLGKTAEIAAGQGLTDGFRTIVNTGRVGRQEVYHLHLHILGGPEPLRSMAL